MTWWQAVLAYVVGPALATAGTVLVARIAAKGSVQAAEVTSEAEEEATAVQGYHQLVADLRCDIDRIREDHDGLRDEHNDLKRHVTTLELQAVRDKSLIRHLILYIRVLRDEIRRLGGRVPEAPGDLEEDISLPDRFGVVEVGKLD